MAAPHCSRVGGNFSLGPKDIFAFCNGAIRVDAAENRSANTNLAVVDDDKTSEVRNAVVVVDDKWRSCWDCESADLVSLQLFACVIFRLQCRVIHVSLVHVG